MSNPNAILTRVRYRLAQWLDPHPDSGEAWCIGCTMNDRRTLILNANGHREHVEQHRTTQPHSAICMRVNYGQVRGHDYEEP